MEYKNYQLRALIYGKYPSQSALARQIGWPRQRLSKIANGDMVPNLNDLKTLADALDIPFLTLAQFFLPR